MSYGFQCTLECLFPGFLTTILIQFTFQTNIILLTCIRGAKSLHKKLVLNQPPPSNTSHVANTERLAGPTTCKNLLLCMMNLDNVALLPQVQSHSSISHQYTWIQSAVFLLPLLISEIYIRTSYIKDPLFS